MPSLSGGLFYTKQSDLTRRPCRNGTASWRHEHHDAGASNQGCEKRPHPDANEGRRASRARRVRPASLPSGLPPALSSTAPAGPRRSVPFVLEEHPRRAARRFRLRALAGALLLAVAGFLALAAPVAAQTHTTLWTAELAVGTFTLYDDDAFGCNADAASDCADLLSEDEFSYDNTTHKIVLLSSQGEYFDIEFAEPPGEASASFILIVGGTSLAFYADTADNTLWSWDSPPAPMWSAGETVTLSIVVAAPAENIPPEFPAESATRSFPENSFAMRLGPSFSATDADDTEDEIVVLTYSLEGEHADFFNLVPFTIGQVSRADIWTTDTHTYDHEAVSEYNVTVKVEDGDGGADTIAVTITVTDVDEPPLPPFTPTVSAVSGSSDSLEVTWTARDNSGKPDIESYDLRYRKGDSGDWADGPQGVTATTATIGGLDEPSAYQVQVRATNDEGDSEWSPAGALGQAPNTAPVFTSFADFLTFENQVVSFFVTAEDPDDGDAVTYAITGGADQAVFSMLDATSGQVFAPLLDHENPRDADSNNVYLLTVTATGGTGARALTTDQNITVTVRDRAEVPRVPSFVTVQAVSHTTDSLSVNWLVSTRPDIPSTESYDLRYREGTTGDWADGPQNRIPNHAIIGGLESGTEYQVQVRATNEDGDSDWSESSSGSTNAPPDAAQWSVTAAPAAIEEDGGVSTVTVSTGGATFAAAQTIDLSFGGSATAGTDFTVADAAGNTLASPYALTLPIGDSTVTATITAVDDVIDDDDEQIQVTATQNGATLGEAATITITDDDVPPTIDSVAFTSDPGADDTYAIGDALQATVTFSAAVTVTGTPQFVLDVGGAPRSAAYESGIGSTDLVFSYTVVEGDEDTDGVSVEKDEIALNGGTITAGGTAATLTYDAVAADPDHKVDGVRPMLVSAKTSADGATVILTFDEQLAAIDLAPGHFTGNVAGSARAVSSALASGTAATLTLASPVTAGQTVRMGYSGTTGRSSAIQDLPGNTAAAIASTHDVTNNAVNTPPEFPESIPDVSMPENSLPGLDIGDPVVATDADGHTLTYSLLQGSGTDGSSFDIDLSTGQLRTRSGVTYSYEEQKSFIVQVRVDDGNGGTDGVFVEIELTDVAEPPLAPDPPTVSPVPGSSDRLSVSWTAPDNTGKPDIDSYDLQYRKGTSGPFTDGPQAVADTMATIGGLDANASYQVRVRATNDEGDGPWSSAGTGSTSADTTPPTLTSAYSGPEDLGAAVHLIFSEDLDVDNLPFASAFRLTADGSPVAINLAQIGNSDNEFVLLALAPVIRMGQTVVVTYIDPSAGDDTVALQDTAGNDVANFTRTLENNSTQVPAAPGAPTGLGATAAGQTRIDLAWTAPADNGGRAISGYRIEWSGAGADPWTELVADTDSTETTYADTGLAAGTTRHYRVAAINTVGTGSASDPASATTTTATPGPPRDLQATAGTGKVTLAWQAPAHEGASAITHYEYQRAGSSGVFGIWTTAETVAFGSNSSSAILRDATTLDDYDVRAQTTYTYRVRAVNAAGNGAVSEFNSATTGAALTVKVEVAQPNVAENEGPVAVTVVAELPATGANEEKYDLEFQVDVFTAGISTTIRLDYTSLALEATFMPGEFQMESGRWVASKPLTVTLIDDAVVEPDETFLVGVERARITDPSHPFITFPGATDDVTVTIVNDDVPKWAVNVAPDTIAEAAGTATVTVSTGGVTFTAAQTIDLSFDGGSATAGTDFTVADANGNALTSPYALTLSMGDSTVTATITAVDDLVDDDDEQIQVTATQNGDKLGEAQTLTITDDDTASTGIELGLNPASVTEGGGAQTITVTAALDGTPRATATDVTVSRTGGTATSGTDYAAVSDFTITIPAASTSATGTFSFAPTDDTVAEGAETVILTGSATGLSSAHGDVDDHRRRRAGDHAHLRNRRA